MARGKKCEEEFNPWPPFVDVFSSVVLVLLLFILILIVNVAYYMKFNSKVDSTATTKSTTNNLQSASDITDMVTLAKMQKPKEDAGGKESLFSGGKSAGNALSIEKKEKKKLDQNVINKDGEMMIIYKDKGLFADTNTKVKIKAFIKKIKSKNPNAKIEISLGKPLKVLGRSNPKQIALGRALGVKSIIQKSGFSLSKLKLNLKNQKNKKYEYGYLKLKII